MQTNTLRLFAASLVVSALYVPVSARAHGSGHGHLAGAAPTLHVGDEYESCYFDLHSELTQAQFRTFTREGAAVVRFQQLAPAQTLGAGTLSVGLAMTATPINDAKGAWNNTFSHPEDDHYLGDVQQFPRLVLRYGLNQAVDVGVWGSVNPTANYGFVGVDAKVTLVDTSLASMPVRVSVRPSATSVLGPDELWFGNVGVDVTAGLTVAGLSPYVGVGGTLGIAKERTDEVALDTELTLAPAAVTGLAYRVWRLELGVEATWSTVNTYGVLVGLSI